jgi:hypothetical protein
MNSINDPDDEELRDRVHALGCDAEQRAPAFPSVWHGAQRILAGRKRDQRLSAIQWALPTAAVVSMVCLVLGLWLGHSPRKKHVAKLPVPEPLAIEPITSEEPETPTDFLLTATNDSRTPSVEQLTREIDALLKP